MIPSTQPGGKPTLPDIIRSMVDDCNSYCGLQIERSGDVPLPQTEDPFDDDLGYGAAIHVVSTNIHHRLTWGILKSIMQGLWDFLIEGRRYLVRKPEETLFLGHEDTWLS